MTEAIQTIDPPPAGDLPPVDPPAGDPPPPPPVADPAPAGDPPPVDPPPSDEPPKKESPWADDWREQMAGGDEDIAKAISRYGSPSGVAKALKEAQKTLRQGSQRPERPKDFADEKAMSEWRKAAGVPEEAAGYVIPEKVQKRLLDEDKPVLAQFTEFAHKRGMPTEYVTDATEWYLDTLDAISEQQKAEDAAALDKCDDKLRSEWVGAEYKGNMSLAKRFVEDRFGIPFNELSEARLPNGQKIGNNPDIMMRLSDLGRDNFGDAAFANSDVAQKYEDRKKFIEHVRDNDFDRYEREFAKEYRQMIEDDLKRSKKR